MYKIQTVVITSSVLLQIFFTVVYSAKFNDVTCGSVIKLQQTNYKVRLHSHEVKYGSGSGQQSVTGVESIEDVNSHWVVKDVSGKHCTRGEPIECGKTIRLEHLITGRNLHSHLFSSPLSGAQEVSAFGDGGEGDTGDHWTVICEGNNWQRDKKVLLKHADTNMFSPFPPHGVIVTDRSSSGHTYGRPINGQMEVCATSQPDSTTNWLATEGIYIKPVEEHIKHHEHTEL